MYEKAKLGYNTFGTFSYAWSNFVKMAVSLGALALRTF